MRQFPNTRALMLGRGLIANPALAQSLGGGEALCKASLRAFHDRLLAAYQAKYPAHVTPRAHAGNRQAFRLLL